MLRQLCHALSSPNMEGRGPIKIGQTTDVLNAVVMVVPAFHEVRMRLFLKGNVSSSIQE
jgi:hypothetical protein